LFEGRYLKVKRATDPSLILWENLGYTMTARAVRTLFTTIVAFLLVCVVIALNVYQRTADDAINKFSP